MSFDPSHVCYGCFKEKEPGTVCPKCGFNESSERAYLAVPLGTILDGRYLIGKVLGVGGFGITYLGYDLTLDYKVAVKEYMPSGFATRADDKYTLTVTSSSQQQAYDEGLDKFLSEARTLAKFHSTPNIVSVQDFFKENNTAYFVMEYVDGESLKDYLDKNGGRISYQAASKILLPIMKALSKVHAQGLIHRDISPDNISITSTGEPKLLDFGAARSAYAENKSVSVILKHGLAPIEQYSNHGNMGPWTDVYAMGATFYRSITGILPPESIERIHSDSIRTPSSLGIAIPPYAEMALMKALAVNPENRFANIEQFMGALNGNTAYSAAPAQAPVAQNVATVPAQRPVYPAAQNTVAGTVYAAAQPSAAYNRSYTGNQPAAPAAPAAAPAVSASAATAPAAPKKKGMSKGALAGIIIGCVALVLTVVITVVAINVANNPGSKPRHTTESTEDSGGGHFGSKQTTEVSETSESASRITESSMTASGSDSGSSGSGAVTKLGDVNASIWIPDGYKKNDKGAYVTTNGGISVKFSEMVNDTPVYDIDDVAANKAFFIEHFLSKNCTETYSGKYTLPSGVTGFEIDGEYSGTKFILFAVPCYNPSEKPGCYFISVWFRNSDEGNKLISSIKSFVSTGEENTRLDDFTQELDSNTSDTNASDVKIKFLFEPSFASAFMHKNGSISIVNNTNESSKSIVIVSSVFSTKSETQVRSDSKAEFETQLKKNNNATLKSTKTDSVTYGNITWTVDTHDFGTIEAKTITASYPNGMVVSIQEMYKISYRTKANNYIKDLQRSIRLLPVT